MGGVTINVQVPVSDDRFPSARRQPPAGLHPERHPAHERRRGAPLRPLAPRLERLRPRRCASSACCCRCASRPTRRSSSRACPSSSRRSRRRSRPTSRSTSWRRCSGSPRRSTPRTSAPTCSPRRFYQKEYLRRPRGYIIVPNVSKIRAAVKNAFTADPADEAQRQKLAEEAAGVWVLNGTSDTGRGTRHRRLSSTTTALAASAPRQKPPGAVPANTTIVVYNGAETQTCRDTIAYLEKTFGVTVDDEDRPGHPDGHRRHDRQDDAELEAPPSS